jgi:hypothetical protein
MSKVLALALRKSADQLEAAKSSGERQLLDDVMLRNAEAWEIIGADLGAGAVDDTKRDIIRLRDFVRAVNVEYLAKSPIDPPVGVEALVAINRSIAGGFERRAENPVPDHPDILEPYADVLALIADLNLQSATNRLLELAETRGEDAGLFTVIGILQSMNGDGAAACQSFEAAIALDQYAGEARNALIRHYEIIGDEARSSQHLSMARSLISHMPQWNEASELTQLAVHSMQEVRYSEAFALALRASQLAPWMTDPWWLMSFLTREEKDLEQAVQFAMDACMRNVADARLRHHLVSTFYLADRGTEGLAHHRQAVKQFANHPDKELRRFFSA